MWKEKDDFRKGEGWAKYTGQERSRGRLAGEQEFSSREKQKGMAS